MDLYGAQPPPAARIVLKASDFVSTRLTALQFLRCPEMFLRHDRVPSAAAFGIKKKNYSNCFPFVSGSCDAMTMHNRKPAAHSQNAMLNPLVSATLPMV